MFYKGMRFWEVHLYVFYVSGRLSGGSGSNGFNIPGGSAKEKTLKGVGEGMGGSICRVSRGSEALGGSGSNEAKAPGGSAKEGPSRAWGEGEGGQARSVVFYEGL